MAPKIKQFIKYDRVLLGLSATFLILLGLFLYYYGNTNQTGCDPYYLRTAVLLYQFMALVVTVLSVYTFIRLTKPASAKPTNWQLFRVIAGVTGIVLANLFVYVFIEFLLFFAKSC